jgi:hypothetical protein
MTYTARKFGHYFEIFAFAMTVTIKFFSNQCSILLHICIYEHALSPTFNIHVNEPTTKKALDSKLR